MIQERQNQIHNMMDEINEAVANQQEVSEIAHYTSIKVLHNIIRDVKSSEDNSTLILRATSALYTNDKDELKNGYDFLKDTLKKLENGSQIPESLRLSSFLDDTKQSEKYRRYTEKKFLNWFYDGVRTPYVISFTRYIDQLHLWQKPYGRTGEGCCLVFDFAKMKYDNADIDINTPLAIVYSNRIGYLETTKTFFSLIFMEYNKYLKNASGVNEKDCILGLKLQTIDVLCGFVSSYFKGEEWHDEQEWRLMCTTKDENSDCIKQDEKGRPYVEVPIPLKCLNRIVLGSRVKTNIVNEIKRNACILGLSPENIFISKTPLK